MDLRHFGLWLGIDFKMKSIKLDTVLLFALLVPFIMAHRISPGDTPYWLFGFIFLGLLAYISLDLFFDLKLKLLNILKMATLWALIIATIGSGIYSEVVVRHQSSPTYNVHDIILQQESAIRFLIHGANPYSTTYFGTPLENWHYSDTEVNPALYHFVMGPFYLIFAIPFYFISTRTFGFFDGRIPLFFLFFSLLIMAGRLVKDEEKKRQFITLLAFNPAMLGYAVEGRSDIFMFAFLFAAFYLLSKEKLLLSGIPMAAAFAVKQSVWPILPFYVAYLFFKTKNVKQALVNLLPFGLAFIVLVSPFLIWDYRSFLDSTVFYLSGTAQNSYPVSGYGLGMILNQAGVIKDVHEYFPFHIFQIVIGVPLAWFLVVYLKKNPSVSRLIAVYGLFLFVFWYLSRYFNNSHLGYLSMVFITAYFWPKAKEA